MYTIDFEEAKTLQNRFVNHKDFQLSGLQKGEEIEKTKVMTWTIHARIVMYAALGRHDEAFQWLDNDPLHAYTAWLAVMPEGKGMRKDPRFQDFLARLNLPN